MGLQISALLLDKEREEKGIWVDFFSGEVVEEPDPERFEVLVGSFYSRRFRNALTEDEIQGQRLRTREGSRDKESADRRIASAMAKELIHGWRHIYDGEIEIPYSKEAVLDLLNESLEFLDGVGEISRNRELFRRQHLEQAAGNSSAPSNGR